jgi:hypothetical protein
VKKIIFILCVFIQINALAQNKSGYTTIFGGGGVFATFDGSTNRPITGQLFSNTWNWFFNKSHSNICDSATGKLLFICNGMIIYDTVGNIMENGDSLQPNKIYSVNQPADAWTTQGSLILPKGSNGLYYVFTPSISDTMFDYWNTNPLGDGRVPYNLLQYHIVDINANNGLGKVIQKKLPLLTNVELNKTGMMACRHANGYDWWLLKQGVDTNIVYTFLITKDTVVLDTIQGFTGPRFGYLDVVGQSCFSSDGSKYAFLQGNCNKLFVADFDRCYGILSNPKVYNIPIDSTTIPNPQPQYKYDSTFTGVCFSPNDSFIYISKRFNIYQYELNNSDSSTAWFQVKHGEDTSLIQFAYYGQLQMGIDKRIYIGKGGGTGNSNSVIDYPNLKGSACGFCRKCLRMDTTQWYTHSLANMPDFNLGKKVPCWPLSNEELVMSNEELVVYPNPSNTKIQIKCKIANSKKELFNSVGQLIFSTFKNEIDVSNYSKGIYYLRCGIQTKKIIIE